MAQSVRFKEMGTRAFVARVLLAGQTILQQSYEPINAMKSLHTYYSQFQSVLKVESEPQL